MFKKTFNLKLNDTTVMNNHAIASLDLPQGQTHTALSAIHDSGFKTLLLEMIRI
jgi:hypothetical protein